VIVMLTCNDAYVLIVRTIDDARLSGDERAALRRHLGACATCRGEYETQHEVRRLLVIHIQDQLPAGFDERLNARLAQTSRPLTSGLVRDTTPPSAIPRWPEVEAARHRDMRGRTWALRLIPLAATLALIVAGTSVRDGAPPFGPLSEAQPGTRSVAGAQSDEPADAPSAAGPASVRGTASGQPRAFTTIVLPRHDGPARRDRLSSVSRDDAAQSPQPLVDDGHAHGAGQVADSGAAVENAPRAAAAKVARDAKEVPSASDFGDRAPAAEPRGQDREPVARRERERDAGRKRDANDERDAGGERATSQRPGILPRPTTPFPQARPAMPAPPAVIPEPSIPPW
jgi:predicted anti-sigma-YlaC factor YlaD